MFKSSPWRARQDLSWPVEKTNESNYHSFIIRDSLQLFLGDVNATAAGRLTNATFLSHARQPELCWFPSSSHYHIHVV